MSGVYKREERVRLTLCSDHSSSFTNTTKSFSEILATADDYMRLYKSARDRGKKREARTNKAHQSPGEKREKRKSVTRLGRLLKTGNDVDSHAYRRGEKDRRE